MWSGMSGPRTCGARGRPESSARARAAPCPRPRPPRSVGCRVESRRSSSPRAAGRRAGRPSAAGGRPVSRPAPARRSEPPVRGRSPVDLPSTRLADRPGRSSRRAAAEWPAERSRPARSLTGGRERLGAPEARRSPADPRGSPRDPSLGGRSSRPMRLPAGRPLTRGPRSAVGREDRPSGPRSVRLRAAELRSSRSRSGLPKPEAGRRSGPPDVGRPADGRPESELRPDVVRGRSSLRRRSPAPPAPLVVRGAPLLDRLPVEPESGGFRRASPPRPTGGRPALPATPSPLRAAPPSRLRPPAARDPELLRGWASRRPRGSPPDPPDCAIVEPLFLVQNRARRVRVGDPGAWTRLRAVARGCALVRTRVRLTHPSKKRRLSAPVPGNIRVPTLLTGAQCELGSQPWERQYK